MRSVGFMGFPARKSLDENLPQTTIEILEIRAMWVIGRKGFVLPPYRS